MASQEQLRTQNWNPVAQENPQARALFPQLLTWITYPTNYLPVNIRTPCVDLDLPGNDDTNCGNPASLPLPSVGESSAPHSASLPLLDTCNNLEEWDTVSSPERELSNAIGLHLK